MMTVLSCGTNEYLHFSQPKRNPPFWGRSDGLRPLGVNMTPRMALRLEIWIKWFGTVLAQLKIRRMF